MLKNIIKINKIITVVFEGDFRLKPWKTIKSGYKGNNSNSCR